MGLGLVSTPLLLNTKCQTLSGADDTGAVLMVEGDRGRAVLNFEPFPKPVIRLVVVAVVVAVAVGRILLGTPIPRVPAVSPASVVIQWWYRY